MSEKNYSAVTVTAEHKGVYSVLSGGMEIPAVLSGKLLGCAVSRLDLPVVGDTVDVSLADGGLKAVIHGVHPRSSLLLRRETAGRDVQPLAANIAKAVIVMGLDGNYNIARLERLLVAVGDGGASPAVALTKSDLCSPEELERKISAAEKAAPGVGVLSLSSVDGTGIERIYAEISGSLCCFIGSSGVGKSTLLNRLAGKYEAETGEVRDKDSRGRHTTTSRQLYFLSDGTGIIDTPGIREFCVEYSGSGIDASFADIAELAAGCRFGDCSHSGEPGCAVTAAVEAGSLSADRLKNYMKLRRETARCGAERTVRGMIEAKRREKRFGRSVRDILVQKKRLRGG